MACKRRWAHCAFRRWPQTANAAAARSLLSRKALHCWARSPQVQHLIGHPWVEIDVVAQLVDGLPRLRGRVVVEAALGAALHKLEAPRGGQPEDADAAGGVAGGHHDGHSLVQHRLGVGGEERGGGV